MPKTYFQPLITMPRQSILPSKNTTLMTLVSASKLQRLHFRTNLETRHLECLPWPWIKPSKCASTRRSARLPNCKASTASTRAIDSTTCPSPSPKLMAKPKHQTKPKPSKSKRSITLSMQSWTRSVLWINLGQKHVITLARPPC